jgi:hypothetical protein
MPIPSKGPVTLKTNLADHPVTMGLKERKISSANVSFDFWGRHVLKSGGVCVIDVHIDPGEERSAAATTTTRKA